MVKKINEEQFELEAKKSPVAVVDFSATWCGPCRMLAPVLESVSEQLAGQVDFWATWCGPCRMLAPTIARIAEEQEGKIKVGKIDVDEEPELSVQYGIASIPTLMVFKNGQVVNKSIGVIPKAAIEALLN